MASLTPTIPDVTYVPLPARDPLTEARDRIRTAMRLLTSLDITINAYACDDQFGQPNRATDARDELALALAALAEVR